MMHQITREQVTKFLVEQQPPCISLYLPTHRRHPENQQDPIRFRNLLQTLERTLSQTFPQRKTEVLARNRHEAKLYEGNLHTLDEVELTNEASTIGEALGEDLTEQHLTVASYGTGATRTGGGGAAPSIHAHGNKTDEVDSDRDRFFRSIDRSILEHHSRPSGLPLMRPVVYGGLACDGAACQAADCEARRRLSNSTISSAGCERFNRHCSSTDRWAE